MNTLSFQAFGDVYQNEVRKVFRYWTRQMQYELSEHCYGWHPDRFDFQRYLEASAIRFYHAYCAITECGQVKTVCDVGGFWGVFPITLKVLGYDVTMTESLKYYSDTFRSLFQFIEHQGVAIIDVDPFQQSGDGLGRYDAITVMAVLEHYPHSPKLFMENVSTMMNPNGHLYIEVPNIAYWPKRMRLLRGNTPHVDIGEKYYSKVPFIGHHHEYTIGELRDLAAVSKLHVLKEFYFNYSETKTWWKRWLKHPLESFVYMIRPDTRECIAVLCQQSDNI